MKYETPEKKAKTFSGSIVGLTLIAVLGSTLAIAPAASAKDNDLFDVVRQLLGGKPASRQPVTDQKGATQELVRQGDQEIAQRLQTLATLQAKIDKSVKLSAQDKAALTNQINVAITELNALKVKLDASMNEASARSILQSISANFRSYGQLVPKVHLLKLADDILATDAKLSAHALKLQVRVASAEKLGKDVASLQAKLTDMAVHVASAEKIANDVRSGVLNMQLTSGNGKAFQPFNAQLKSARQDIRAAYADARSIVDALKQE